MLSLNYLNFIVLIIIYLDKYSSGLKNSELDLLLNRSDVTEGSRLID